MTFALVVTLAILSFAPARAQEVPEGPTFRVESKLVNVWVNVTDQNGAIIGGLTKNDFKVFEDERPQEISIFERQSEQPLDIILAIDTSESTFKDRALEKTAAKHFIHAMLRPQDQFSVFQFATYVTQLVPFTNNEKALERGVNSLKSGEATALYDAVALGSQELAKKHDRKVLVIVSDGGDTVNNTSYAQALEAALRADTMIYSVIDVPIESSAGRDLGGEHALITLSEQTGGKSFYVEQGDLDKAFAKVSDDLRTQYLIGYYPKNQKPDVSFHRIRVTIPRAAPNAFNLRYRTGYYSGPPPKPRHIDLD